ncbi:MAG TPA: glycine oxidase ThiO [Thermoleophilaceae bacterium]|nr:glycine oxidase ThiO [Thermoleophilaceae bacterium]
MRAPLPTKRHDVAVVGGGIVGLACAWYAARRGQSVVVLERDRLGHGASGVAAGMLAPVTEADFGEDELLQLNVAAAARWPAFAAELEAAAGIGTGFRETGALVVATDGDDAEELRRLADLHASLGLPSRWLSPRECRALEPGLSPRVRGAIHAPSDHQADPAATVRALASACRAAGVELCENVEVAELVESGGRVTGVATATGTVEAGAVVVAAGAWTASLAPDAPPVRPVKGQIAALRAADPALALTHVVRTPRCYLLARADGRIVLGATVEERGFDLTTTADGVFRLLEAAREILPDVGELEWASVRAGLRPGTPDNLPVVGADRRDGLVWATGHFRNGVLLAPLTGALVADLLETGAAPPESLAPDRFAAAGATR